MKLIVNIPKETYEAFMAIKSINLGRCNNKSIIQKCFKAFKNGTVLSECKAENTVSEEVYTQEYLARKEADLEVYKLKKKIEAMKCDAEDCISRASALNLMRRNWNDFNGDDAMQKSIIDIRALPSVTPQEPRWIPVSERLPKDLEPVNITWINHDPEPYYNDIKDKPFTATGVYFNGQWYWWSTLCTDILAEYSHNYDDIVDDDIEITAWQPLPQSFEPQESEDKE